MEEQKVKEIMKARFNPPVVIKRIFSDFLWNTVNNEILLTFDDGPNPGTTEIITETLYKANLKAVFFCVGNNVRNYPHLVDLMIKQGHTIANHTHNHRDVNFLTREKTNSEIIAFNEILQRNFDYEVRYFRPPHGRFGINLGKELQKLYLKNVMWSLLTFDYKNDINIIKFAVKNYLRPDSIVVFHDSWKSKDIIKESIEFLIDFVKELDYKIGVPSECLK